MTWEIYWDFFLVILYLLQRYKEFLEYTNIYKSIFDFYKFNTQWAEKRT